MTLHRRVDELDWRFSPVIQQGSRSALACEPDHMETHRTRMMQKLNLHNTAEIVLYAVRKKIVTAE